MRSSIFTVLFAVALRAQMPAFAPVPAGSKPIDPNVSAGAFTFVVAGDNRPAKRMCAQPPQLGAIASAIAAMQPRPAFVLWNGDIIYGKEPGTGPLQYPAFLSGIAAAGVPVFVVPGNHEASISGTIPCPVPGEPNRKEKPIDEPDPTGKMLPEFQAAIGRPYGVFRYGNSAFIGLDTDDALDPDYQPGHCGYNGFVGNAQIDALKTTLDALQADTTVAHIFVFMHRPIHGEASKNNLGPSSVKQIARLYAYLQPRSGMTWTYTKLSYVFASHEHLFHMHDPTGELGQKGPFSRTDPSSTGPNFVVTGGAGAPLANNGTGRFFHYLVVNVNGKNVTMMLVPVTNISSSCS
jgi:hypothetical protein